MSFYEEFIGSRRYPRCFPRQPLCGAGCGEGWWPILHDLFAELEALPLDEHFAIDQVKEKFGGLRVYTSTYPDGVGEAIVRAEQRAAVTCETCGAPGEERGAGWVKTRCDACQAAWEAERSA